MEYIKKILFKKIKKNKKSLRNHDYTHRKPGEVVRCVYCLKDEA